MENISKSGIPFIENLIVEKVHKDAVVPVYKTFGDSGMDIYAIYDTFIHPGENILIPTGLKFGIPNHPLEALGYRWEMQARPRSGVSLKTFIRVSNSPGTIDNYYMDEVGIIISNINPPRYELASDNGAIVLEEKMVNWAYNLSGKKVLLKDLGYENTTVPYGTYFIEKGDRYAQIVFNEVVRPTNIIEGKLEDYFSKDRHRGSGFGGTGLK